MNSDIKWHKQVEHFGVQIYLIILMSLKFYLNLTYLLIESSLDNFLNYI